MASTHSLDELMASMHFQKLVGDILAIVANAQQHPDTKADMANDALTFVNAMIAEANPHHAGRQGLKAAQEGLSDDASAILRALRGYTKKRRQS